MDSPVSSTRYESSIASGSTRDLGGLDGSCGNDLPAMLVGVRVRPPRDESPRKSASSSAERRVSTCDRLRLDEDENMVDVLPPAQGTRGRGDQTPGRGEPAAQSFSFDMVLGPGARQSDLWRQVRARDLVDKVCDGYHGTIFVYGQTGSGKTHTMEGRDAPIAGQPPLDTGGMTQFDDGDSMPCGLVPRTVRHLFDRVAQLGAATGDKFTVSVSYLQIYNERIFDLLNPAPLNGDWRSENVGLRLRCNSSNEFFVENLFCTACATPAEAMRHVQLGARQRQIASHDLNCQSSRSHCVLTLTVERTSDPMAGTLSTVKVSKLFLVDLAGSERAAVTGVEGVQRKEANCINQSLFVLRRCISTLVQQQQQQSTEMSQNTSAERSTAIVPYRESKLTALLKCALGGNAYTIMIACVAPEDAHIGDSASTLHYATQARAIRNVPKVNLDPKSALIQQLREQLRIANARVAYAEQKYNETTGEVLIFPSELDPPMPLRQSSASPRKMAGSQPNRGGGSDTQSRSTSNLLSPERLATHERRTTPSLQAKVHVIQTKEADFPLSRTTWEPEEELESPPVRPRKEVGLDFFDALAECISPIRRSKMSTWTDLEGSKLAAEKLAAQEAANSRTSDPKPSVTETKDTQRRSLSKTRGTQTQRASSLTSPNARRHSASAPRLRVQDRRGSASPEDPSSPTKQGRRVPSDVKSCSPTKTRVVSPTKAKFMRTFESQRSSDSAAPGSWMGLGAERTDSSTSALVAALDQAIAAHDDDALVSALLRPLRTPPVTKADTASQRA